MLKPAFSVVEFLNCSFFGFTSPLLITVDCTRCVLGYDLSAAMQNRVSPTGSDWQEETMQYKHVTRRLPGNSSGFRPGFTVWQGNQSYEYMLRAGAQNFCRYYISFIKYAGSLK